MADYVPMRFSGDGPFEKLLQLPEAKELFLDDSFRKELYASITNTEWEYVIGDEKQRVYDRLKGLDNTWGPSFRGAGGLIADSVNYLTPGDKPLTYMDFYCCSQEGIVSERIETLFNSLGWRLVKTH